VPKPKFVKKNTTTCNVLLLGGGDFAGASFTLGAVDTGIDFSLGAGGSTFSAGGAFFSDFKSANGKLGFAKSSETSQK